MKNDTQKEWVKKQLHQFGFISRNDCLGNFISRLGAIIADLRDEGYVFRAEYKKTERGHDYVYTMIGGPGKEVNKLF